MAICPPSLNPGDRIAIVAPAGRPKRLSDVQAGCRILCDMGFEVVDREKTWPGHDYFSATDRERLEEFHRVWADPTIKAMIALRGGFGSLRLLERLDLSILRKQSKLLIGFSDITILLNHIFLQTELICLHGPVLTSLPACSRQSLERLYHCLRGNWHKVLKEDVEIVRKAPETRGPLLGGNLSSLTTLLGTPWSPDFKGAILLLEDVNEPRYRLDRLLTQLYYSGVFNQVSGIILGQFSMDRESDLNDRLRCHEFVWNRVAELTSHSGIPVWGSFPVGHQADNLTLPIGAIASMDSNNGTLDFSAGT